MDGVVEGSVGGDDYVLWQASADPAHRTRHPADPEPRPQPLRDDRGSARPAQSWVQTTTLEGNHDWDTWLLEGSTGFDTEFVVAGEPFPFTIFGYVPGPTSKYQVRPDRPTPTGSSRRTPSPPAGPARSRASSSAMKVYVPTTGGACLPGTIWGGLCGAKIDKPIDGRRGSPSPTSAAATPPSGSSAADAGRQLHHHRRARRHLHAHLLGRGAEPHPRPRPGHGRRPARPSTSASSRSPAGSRRSTATSSTT